MRVENKILKILLYLTQYQFNFFKNTIKVKLLKKTYNNMYFSEKYIKIY